MENKPTRFGPVAIALHWGIAVFAVTVVILGWAREAMEAGATKDFTLMIHKSVGLTILILTAFRLVWRFSHRAPPLPGSMTTFQRLAAWGTHFALYAITLGMPISGYLSGAARGRQTSFFNLFTVPQLSPLDSELARITHDMHIYGQWVLIALVVAHVGAALYHRFVLRDGILARMWPQRNERA